MLRLAAQNKDLKGRVTVFTRIVPKITAEAFEELMEKDIPEYAVSYYMKQTAGMAWYAATGESHPDMPLPKDFSSQE